MRSVGPGFAGLSRGSSVVGCANRGADLELFCCRGCGLVA